MRLWIAINVKNLVQRLKLGSHKETIPLFIVTCLGSLLPILIGAILLARKGEPVYLHTFYRAGEFYLYSAGFLTSAGYIFYTYKEKNYDIYSILCLLNALIIFIDALLYALLISDSGNTAITFLKWTSISFLIFSIVALYIASYMSVKNVDLLKSEKRATESITNKLPDYE